MKRLQQFINEELNKLILEAFKSKSIGEFLSITDKEKKYQDWHSYRILASSKIADPGMYLFKKDIAKYLTIANWEEDWFYSKNGKTIFNQEEFCNILQIDEKAIHDPYKLRDIAIKKSPLFLLFVENGGGEDIKKIIGAMILNPKYSDESWEYIKNMKKIQKGREDNANTFKNPDNNLKGTWKMERANKVIKEYYKKASQEQIDLLTNTVKKLMQYTNRGKIAKEQALKYHQSKNYSDEQAHIIYYLIKSETGDDFLRVFSWTDKLDDKLKKYLSEVVEKLKVK